MTGPAPAATRAGDPQQPWFAVYVGYDDAALAALANPGLLRRARKEVTAGAVLLAEEWSGGATVTCGSASVRLSAAGPAASSCSCPAVGACQHLVAALLFARGLASASSVPDAAAPVESGAPSAAATSGTAIPDVTVGAPGHIPDPLADLLALSPEEVNRAAGLSVVRKVAAEIADLGGDDSGGVVAEAQPCAVTPDGPRLRITWPGAHVIYVAGAGFAGMLVVEPARPTKAVADALRLHAVVRTFLTHRRAWSWPQAVAAGARGGLTPAQREAAATTHELIERLVRAGLTHAGVDGATALQDSAGRARVAGLHLLQRLTLTASHRLADLAGRHDNVLEADVLADLAEAWGLTVALDNLDSQVGRFPEGGDGGPSGADDGGPGSAGDEVGGTVPGGAARLTPLIGVARRPATAVDQGVIRLIPLGVRGWTGTTGRGVTVTLWDPQASQVRTATNARAAGTDPTFQVGWDLPLLWGATVSRVCAGPIDLHAPEFRDDGTLSITERSSITPAGPFDVEQLRHIAGAIAQAGTGIDAVGFGRNPRRSTLMMLRDVGHVTVDEVAQDVVWPVVDHKGTAHGLRLPAGAVNEPAIKALVALMVLGHKALAVLVTQQPGAGVPEPVSVFIRANTGRVQLVSLSMTPLKELIPTRGRRTSWDSEWRAMHRLLSRITAKQQATRAAATIDTVAGPVQRICQPVLDITESLAATGRNRTTAHQRDILQRCGRGARDMGMPTVEQSIEALTSQTVDVSAVLRAHLVLGRAAALAG